MEGFYEFVEVPIGMGDVKAGDRVVIATYSYSSKPTTYSYGRVETVSEQGNVVTVVGGQKFETKTGYLFTSHRDNKFTSRILKATPELVGYIHRQELLVALHTITWELESTRTLEIMLHAYRAGLAMEMEDTL